MRGGEPVVAAPGLGLAQLQAAGAGDPLGPGCRVLRVAGGGLDEDLLGPAQMIEEPGELCPADVLCPAGRPDPPSGVDQVRPQHGRGHRVVRLLGECLPQERLGVRCVTDLADEDRPTVGVLGVDEGAQRRPAGGQRAPRAPATWGYAAAASNTGGGRGAGMARIISDHLWPGDLEFSVLAQVPQGGSGGAPAAGECPLDGRAVAVVTGDEQSVSQPHRLT